MVIQSGVHEACPPPARSKVCVVILCQALHQQRRYQFILARQRLERPAASPACLRERPHGPRCFLQDGHIALHLAVRRCQMEVIQTLISQGCSVDFQDRHGNTPLHVACKDGNVPIVVALCEASCNLDISNKVTPVGISAGASTCVHPPACGFGPSFSLRLIIVRCLCYSWGPVRSYRLST